MTYFCVFLMYRSPLATRNALAAWLGVALKVPQMRDDSTHRPVGCRLLKPQLVPQSCIGCRQFSKGIELGCLLAY